MILETATFTILPGKEAAFEVAVAAARPLFARARGCRSMALRKVVEDPSSYLLMVEWDTLEDHTVAFRQSEDFQTWRGLVGHCFAAPPAVIHSAGIVFSA